MNLKHLVTLPGFKKSEKTKPTSERGINVYRLSMMADTKKKPAERPRVPGKIRRLIRSQIDRKKERAKFIRYRKSRMFKYLMQNLQIPTETPVPSPRSWSPDPLPPPPPATPPTPDPSEADWDWYCKEELENSESDYYDSEPREPAPIYRKPVLVEEETFCCSRPQIPIHLTFLQALLENANDRMTAVAWAPNNRKLAAYNRDQDQVVYLYDEYGEARDRFPTRPAELPKKGEDPSDTDYEYTVTALAFSPDSTKLAVGQTDGIVFIYKIGDEFRTRKSITNKFVQPSSVTHLLWPNEFEIISGLYDGKLRHTPTVNTRGPRSRTFYHSDSFTIALICNPKGTEIASAHIDGRIAVFGLENSDAPALKYEFQHPCPPYGLAFGNIHILAGGCDGKIACYEAGAMSNFFDFTRDPGSVGFTCACGSPSGLAVVFGSFNRIRIVRWVPRKRDWEMGPTLEVENLYTVTSLVWNKEGTRVIAGTNTGGLHLFETVLKRMKTALYEVEFATPYQAVISIVDPPVSVSVESLKKKEILDIKVLGKERFVVASTLETMIICQIDGQISSEIKWDSTNDAEKFYFENPNACMIFHNGEMTLVEYGNNRVLGTFRTEFTNPHQISVRINERIPLRHADTQMNKKLAYLIDAQTATIVDLVYNANLGFISHDVEIDWIELNETAVKILYRDIRLRLFLVDIDTMEKHSMLHVCTFIQWVPLSDVIVAQGKKNLVVWYNVEAPDQFVEIETSALAYDITHDGLNTLVLAKEGTQVVQIELQSNRIEFGTAMLDGDYIRAMIYLEMAGEGVEVDQMWKQLSREAVEAKELKIAERASCASRDYAKAKYLSDTVDISEIAYFHGAYEDSIYNCMQARILVLSGDIVSAENIFLENENVEGLIQMFISIHKWKEAFRIISDIKHTEECVILIKQYMMYLKRTKQPELVAEFLEDHGNHDLAARLYLKCGLPMKAARVIQHNIQGVRLDPEFVTDLGTSLTNNRFYIEAAEFYDITGNDLKALENYRRSQQYEFALRIAKRKFPGEVVAIEEEWADYLFDHRLMSLACNHYIEAGKLRKALEAAIEGRQWKQALNIITAVDDVKSVAPEYIRIGDYYKSNDELRAAEKCYVAAGEFKRAIKMYMNRSRWSKAYDIAEISPEGVFPIEAEFKARAKVYIQEGNYHEAENIYCAMDASDIAIAMYNDLEHYEDMLRLIEAYHSDHLISAYERVAGILSTRNTKAAEMYYLKCGSVNKIVQMYITAGMWEDALRVAKTHQGQPGFKKVVYLWAVELGPERGLMLLKRFNLVDDCLEYICTQEEGNFQYALKLAPLVSKEWVTDVHVMYGKHLEEHGDYDGAASQYITAKQAQEAVKMYMTLGSHEQAIDIAEEYCRDQLEPFYIEYADFLYKQKHFAKMEMVLLKAQRPDYAVELYKHQGMWTEAFKLCKDFAPRLLNRLQSEFETSSHSLLVRDDVELVDQGHELERIGENRAAIECYLKLAVTEDSDLKLLTKAWMRGANLALNFFKDDYGESVVSIFAGKLGSVGCHHEAAGYLADIGRQQECLEELISGELFEEAQSLASNIDPAMAHYVRMRYAEYLKKERRIDKLIEVDLASALQLLAEEEEWDELLDKAQVDPVLLTIYSNKYINMLIEDREPARAIQVYAKYGVDPWEANIRTFESLVFSFFQESEADYYAQNKQLRDVCFKFLTAMEKDPKTTRQDLENITAVLNMIHLCTNRSAFREIPEMEEMAVKTALSMLRYSDTLPPEKVFYEAAVACRGIGWIPMAFVLMNHYMDLFEAIENGRPDTNGMDFSEFDLTDIPDFSPLPNYHLVSAVEHEEAQEWILSISMDRNIYPELRLDKRGIFEASLRGPKEKENKEVCILTGYPAITNPIKFLDSEKMANKADYDLFYKLVATGEHPTLEDIHRFLIQWTRGNVLKRNKRSSSSSSSR